MLNKIIPEISKMNYHTSVVGDEPNNAHQNLQENYSWHSPHNNNAQVTIPIQNTPLQYAKTPKTLH